MTSSSPNMVRGDISNSREMPTIGIMQELQLSAEDISYVDILARECGAMAVEMRATVGVRTKTGPSDYVTDADLTISHKLIEALKKRFPNDLIVSEEDNHQLREAEEFSKGKRIWLIDPIDGTENYVKQDGQYSTMIGLVVDGIPYYGWIFQPSTDTLFYGGPNHGAWKQLGDKAPQRYPNYDSISDNDVIRLMIGWGDRRRNPWILELPRVRYVSSESLGLKIVKILEDQADVFVNMTGKVKLWDTAAPAAVGLGAGLEVGTADAGTLPYPFPLIQHGTSVIIGRPGSLSWTTEQIHKRATSS